MGKKRGAGITSTRYAAFRGADFSTDPSLVESCRSPLCTNIVADGGGMPQKRLGYRTVQSLGDTVYGLFGAEFGGTVKRLVVYYDKMSYMLHLCYRRFFVRHGLHGFTQLDF